MRLPRWLAHKGLVDQLLAIDSLYADTNKTGALMVEIHYRGGRPQAAKAREMSLPPVFVEINFTTCATSSAAA